MTTPFDASLSGFRYVQTQYGDTLQDVAARELGDTSKWTLLISINNLVYPFLTDDPSSVTDGVILNGSYIVVPAPQPASETSDPDSVFCTDILLESDGSLGIENGDFATVSGTANLSQALNNAIGTDQGELKYHLGYGCLIRRYVGRVNGPTTGLLAAQAAKQTVAADPRISSVTSAIANVTGDVIPVRVVAKTVAGTNVPISTDIQT
ncbi:hypothetical protein [Burkholderia anthina]|uniref:hypothetical protein n=1 Tax=Burkholderia anthina TaxID=179879 RepID=UPI00158EC7E4|nr:hypothetical protein [Burkholderia anthina]